MRLFVTVFGNSSYAVSVVLCAFMAGLGAGGWWFGKLADRRRDRLLIYALTEVGITIWALLIPTLLVGLRLLVPVIFSCLSSRLLVGLVRFCFAFLILFIPCTLMGGALPVLSRFCVDQHRMTGRRVSLLYGLNTLGASLGCFASGFYLIESIGLSKTNYLAAGVNLLIVLAVLVVRHMAGKSPAGQLVSSALTDVRISAPTQVIPPRAPRHLLLAVAFFSGFSGLCLEVLWIRYLVFAIPNNQYSFTSILGVLLLGLGIGSLIYRALVARRRQLSWLAVILMLLGPTVLLMLAVGAQISIRRGPYSLLVPFISSGSIFLSKTAALELAGLTILLPTILMGMIFPLVCALFTDTAGQVGQRVGKIYAVNTAGAILGCLVPMLLLVPLLGIQGSIFAIGLSISAIGVLVLAVASRRRPLHLTGASAAAVLVYVSFALLVPWNLTQQLFLRRTQFESAPGADTTFYREGRTATVTVTRDPVGGLKFAYVDGILEVPTDYLGKRVFKLLGTLGVLLHPHPKDVLVLCLGAGVTAGTTVQHPRVESLAGIDLIPEMIDVCAHFAEENNHLLENGKFRPVIEDARNYLLSCTHKYPVIVGDSTHPKSPDSWVLYTREFYRTVKQALTPDSIFAQWLPMHTLGQAEYRIILGTFQSVFPHTGVWLVSGRDETGREWASSLMLATPERLSIDLASLHRRLLVPAVKQDLQPYDLSQPENLLATFFCGEQTVSAWTADLPVNTDDLPYTQYTTRYSVVGGCRWPDFAQTLESVWPYLHSTGGQKQTTELKAALDRRLQAERLILLKREDDAIALLPDSPRMRRLKFYKTQVR